MAHRIRTLVALGAIAILGLVVMASPAGAIFPKLSTSLSGPAFAGATPRGDAQVDQSGLPSKPGVLRIRVSDINVPDGTVLAVNFGGLTAGGGQDIGTIRISGRGGSATITLPRQCGRYDQVSVRYGETVLAWGGLPWKF